MAREKGMGNLQQEKSGRWTSCRYADDCNIYVRSQRAGEHVMESITRFITRRLRLKVNEEKSKEKMRTLALSREIGYIPLTA